MEFILGILLFFVIFIISALPLYLAVALLGRRTNLLKTILVMLVSGIVTSVIAAVFPYGAIVAFLVLIWIYREMFRLRWYKAFLAWLLQIVFVALLLFGLGALGMQALTFSLFL